MSGLLCWCIAHLADCRRCVVSVYGAPSFMTVSLCVGCSAVNGFVHNFCLLACLLADISQFFGLSSRFVFPLCLSSPLFVAVCCYCCVCQQQPLIRYVVAFLPSSVFVAGIFHLSSDPLGFLFVRLEFRYVLRCKHTTTQHGFGELSIPTYFSTDRHEQRPNI